MNVLLRVCFYFVVWVLIFVSLMMTGVTHLTRILCKLKKRFNRFVRWLVIYQAKVKQHERMVMCLHMARAASCRSIKQDYLFHAKIARRKLQWLKRHTVDECAELIYGDPLVW